MSCPRYENQIALYAGGDLPGPEAEELKHHLARCPACAALLEDLRENVVLMTELSGHAIAESEYVALRAIRPRQWWKVAAAAALFLVALGGIALKVQPEVAPPPALAQVRQWAPPPQAPEVRKTVRAPVPVVAREPEQTAKTASEPMVVKLLTSDPDVVIYWIVEGTGD